MSIFVSTTRFVLEYPPGFLLVLTTSRTSTFWSRIIWFPLACSPWTVLYDMENSISNAHISPLVAWYIPRFEVRSLSVLRLMLLARCLGATSSSTPITTYSTQRLQNESRENFPRTVLLSLTKPTISI